MLFTSTFPKICANVGVTDSAEAQLAHIQILTGVCIHWTWTTGLQFYFKLPIFL